MMSPPAAMTGPMTCSFHQSASVSAIRRRLSPIVRSASSRVSGRIRIRHWTSSIAYDSQLVVPHPVGRLGSEATHRLADREQHGDRDPGSLAGSGEGDIAQGREPLVVRLVDEVERQGAHAERLGDRRQRQTAALELADDPDPARGGVDRRRHGRP